MTDAEYHLTAERDELRRQVAGLRAERERWRQIPTPLTDAEREAVQWASETLCVGWHDLDADGKGRSRNAAATLRGLLERTAKRDTTGPRNGAVDTPPTHATPGECSTPGEDTSG